MCVFLKFICIYFFLYYRGPCVRKLFTWLIMYPGLIMYPLKIKNIVLYCIALTKKNVPFVWTVACAEAFDKLKFLIFRNHFYYLLTLAPLVLVLL